MKVIKIRMTAQIYDGETYIRLFHKDGEGFAIADINVENMEKASVDNADKTLAQLKVNRITNWQPREWGLEAGVEI